MDSKDGFALVKRWHCFCFVFAGGGRQKDCLLLFGPERCRHLAGISERNLLALTSPPLLCREPQRRSHVWRNRKPSYSTSCWAAPLWQHTCKKALMPYLVELLNILVLRLEKFSKSRSYPPTRSKRLCCGHQLRNCNFHVGCIVLLWK